jgi:proton-dependent oligopeptide transporter, POT family
MSKSANDRWPSQVKYIVGNEACERFSYYGMRSILAGYITGAVLKGGLGQDEDTATSIIHMFIFANYFMPLFGAWLSDKVVGRYHTILWVSLFYCAGHGVLACSDLAGAVGGVHGKLACLFTGLALIAFGSGGIKPCVSAFVGDQFKPEQSHLLQKAYGAFYWAINFGSFFSFLVIPWLREHCGYKWAFGVPGIAMGLATLVFWIGTPRYYRVPPACDPQWRTKALGLVGFFAGLGLLIYLYYEQRLAWKYAMAALGAGLLVWAVVSTVRLHRRVHAAREKVEANAFAVWWYAVSWKLAGTPGPMWQRAAERFTAKALDHGVSLGRVLSIFALVPVFWALFDQSNSTWVLQGEKMVPFNLWPFPTVWPFTIQIGAEEMQAANPALVMILVPLLTLGLYPRLGKYATPLKRMGLGLFLTAASYVIVAFLQHRVEAGAHLCVAWQGLPYLVLTTGEVLVSTTGLEFAFTQAPPEMKSTIMSFWLLTVAFGSLLVTAITNLLSGSGPGAHAGSVSTSRFLLYAGMTVVVAVLFSLVARRYCYREQPRA